jgi:hypothetical protein
VRSQSASARGALRASALADSNPETITEVRVAGNARNISESAPYRQQSERALSCGARYIIDVGVRAVLAPRQV